MSPREPERCGWARSQLAIEYHDREWGVPVHDDRVLFELLTLEGAQAGLSWDTILAKRAGYRRVFAGFDPERVARFGAARLERALADPGIVRNRLKVESTVTNARAFLRVQEEHGSFDRFLWRYVDGRPIRNAWTTLAEVPATSALSDRVSKEWKRLGFRFVGSTIVYAYLQATGVVDDHLVSCFVRTRRRRKA